MFCTLVLGVGLLPGNARAQDGRRLEFSVDAIVGSARSRALVADTAEVIGGLWLGGAVGVKAGRVSASLTGFRGTLAPIANTPFARDVGQLEARVGFDLRTWLSVEANYTARAFRSSSGYQRWTLLGTGVRLSAPVGDSAVRVYLAASYLPLVRASVAASGEHGLGAEAGVSANLARWTLALNDHFERYDFACGASSRLEEFDWFGFQVAFHIPWRPNTPR